MRGNNCLKLSCLWVVEVELARPVVDSKPADGQLLPAASHCLAPAPLMLAGLLLRPHLHSSEEEYSLTMKHKQVELESLPGFLAGPLQRSQLQVQNSSATWFLKSLLCWQRQNVQVQPPCKLFIQMC